MSAEYYRACAKVYADRTLPASVRCYLALHELKQMAFMVAHSPSPLPLDMRVDIDAFWTEDLALFRKHLPCCSTEEYERRVGKPKWGPVTQEQYDAWKKENPQPFRGSPDPLAPASVRCFRAFVIIGHMMEGATAAVASAPDVDRELIDACTTHQHALMGLLKEQLPLCTQAEYDAQGNYL